MKTHCRGWVAAGSRVGHGCVAGGSRVQVGPGRGDANKSKINSGWHHSPSHHTPREFHDAVRGLPLTLIYIYVYIYTYVRLSWFGDLEDFLRCFFRWAIPRAQSAYDHRSKGSYDHRIICSASFDVILIDLWVQEGSHKLHPKSTFYDPKTMSEKRHAF